MVKCIYCNEEMFLNDVDYNFKGNQDNYWQCTKCNATAFEKIRFNRRLSIKYERGGQ